VSLVATSGETDLNELVRRVVSGDAAAKDELVCRYSRGVTVIIGQILSSAPAIEDVYQETFRIVLQKLPAGELRQPERLSGFICSIARNAAYQYLRTTRRIHSIEDIPNPEQIPDPSSTQLDQILKQEQAAIVRQVLNELRSDRDREVLFRYYIAEQDKDTVCKDLGLSRKQFHNVIYRALNRAKALLTSKAGGP
jgi:RNA polymerase sigma-70 factor, ECF subfamily